MKKTIPVVGMVCSACAANVERKLSGMEGVDSVSVSLPARRAVIDYREDVVTLEQMKAELNSIGFDLVIEADRSVVELERREYRLLLRRMLLSWLFALLCMAVTMRWVAVGGRDAANQLSMMLSLANIVVCGSQFYRRAWLQLRHRTMSMDTLVALSTGIAFLFSTFNTFFGERLWGSRGMEWHTYFDASIMIITFVLTGKVLEEKAKNSTADTLRQLLGLQPKTARLAANAAPAGEGDTSEVPVSTISVGDVLEVRAGEKVPVDGMVTWADSFMTAEGAYVDEAMITGEPTPVLKRRGDKLLSGTILTQGTLRMRARQVGEHTALATIIRMVEQAQGSKAPVQRTVDRLAMVFVPVVLLLSAVTFVMWCIAGGSSQLPQAVLSAVAVLVVACPCAMGLATPTALMVGIGKAAQHNMLIKDAAALENIRKVDALVIDKTGTLTIPNRQIDFTRADNLPFEQRETLKPNAREAMEQLQRMGIEVYLMSGDKPSAVEYWAGKAGIANYQSGVKPQDKQNLVGRLQQQGKVVAMVGDGINDTQALALADVSIAMAAGTDVAIDVAQLTLMGDDLRSIPQAVLLSRRTVSMIHQNLFWAFIYNMVAIPLAAGLPYAFGYHFQITPMWASCLMAMSSVSVVLNSLRLKYA